MSKINTKFEARNPKQIQKTKIIDKMKLPNKNSRFEFRIFNLDIVSNFGFSASNFKFRYRLEFRASNFGFSKKNKFLAFSEFPFIIKK